MTHQRTVVVSGIGKAISCSQLGAHFSEAGDIEHILMPAAKSVATAERSYWFIVFTNEESARAVIKNPDLQELAGNKLVIQLATENESVEIADLMAENKGPENSNEVEETSKTSADPLLAIAKQLALLKKDQIDEILSKVSSLQSEQEGNINKSHQREPTDFTRQSPSVTNFGNSAIPKLPLFTGGKRKERGEVNYSQWRYQLNSLIHSGLLNDFVLLRTIQLSVRDQAAEVLEFMGEDATIPAILQKFDITFGNIQTDQELKLQFYSTKQIHDESIVQFACRLQKLINEIKEKVYISSDDRAEMMRSTFFSGLINRSIKQGIRHWYDNGKDFDVLFKAARSLELEQSSSVDLVKSKSKVSSNQQATTEANVAAEIRNLSQQLAQMNKRIGQLEKEKEKSFYRNYPRSTNTAEKYKKGDNQSGNNQGDLLCERCYHRGHLVNNCHARRDVWGRPLNGQTPVDLNRHQQVKKE